MRAPGLPIPVMPHMRPDGLEARPIPAITHDTTTHARSRPTLPTSHRASVATGGPDSDKKRGAEAGSQPLANPTGGLSVRGQGATGRETSGTRWCQQATPPDSRPLRHQARPHRIPRRRPPTDRAYGTWLPPKRGGPSPPPSLSLSLPGMSSTQFHRKDTGCKHPERPSGPADARSARPTSAAAIASVTPQPMPSQASHGSGSMRTVMHRQRVDVSDCSALAICTCGWRSLASSKAHAWRIAHTHGLDQHPGESTRHGQRNARYNA